MRNISGSDDLHNSSPGSLFEAWEDLPLDDWIHERLCYVYPVHGWVHDRLARILLFSAFCYCQRLPSKEDVWINVSRSFCRRLGYDVCCSIEPFLIPGGFDHWDVAEENCWIPGFSVMSEEECGMSAIFADACNFQFHLDNVRPRHLRF
jgi:hypothetical protein